MEVARNAVSASGLHAGRDRDASPGSSSIISPCRASRRAAISRTGVTIENFAAIVQTMERLKMLFVLTVCDINAVGPGVLDAWKAQLLRVLYWETEVVLGGGHSAVDRKSRVAAAKEELRAALPEWSDERVRRLRAAALSRLLAQGRCRAQDAARAAAAQAQRRARRRSRPPSSSTATRGAVELTVDRAGPSAPAVDHRRRLRGERRQYRRRAYFHHSRRARARHDLLLARLRFRRGRAAPRPPHRRFHRQGAARRGRRLRCGEGARQAQPADRRLLGRA